MRRILFKLIFATAAFSAGITWGIFAEAADLGLFAGF